MEYAVNVVFPVPPPATTAVPNVGSAAAPWEIKGTPVVADGATLVTPFDVAPINTSWLVVVTASNVPVPLYLTSPAVLALIAFDVVIITSLW